MTPASDDLVGVAELCMASLERAAESDWTRRADGVEWTCRQTLEHLCTLDYAYRLATRAETPRSVAVSIRPAAPITDLLWTMRAAALVLAEVARAARPDARAFHVAGMADASGCVAMAMDEYLIHTHDIVTALGVPLAPDPDLALRALDRLFPWWPTREDPWEALLWANGRQALPGYPNPGAEWLWHCAPLDEWDGKIPSWDPIEGTPKSAPSLGPAAATAGPADRPHRRDKQGAGGED